MSWIDEYRDPSNYPFFLKAMLLLVNGEDLHVTFIDHNGKPSYMLWLTSKSNAIVFTQYELSENDNYQYIFDIFKEYLKN